MRDRDVRLFRCGRGLRAESALDPRCDGQPWTGVLLWRRLPGLERALAAQLEREGRRHA